ncbi:class I SAM-dependent methyltransferase [Singulisphaera acidiphila]|uniref:Protein related to regulatory domain of methyltransferases n=1 Tax=Singulisphaera acidiphila (strain ATCC BAA-1392 / DSM 18658 / VKM B-2454 / MOB10) TaxID=886293 RepID=L0DBU3_SINAD|nr:class I SAM-dependent methyltransferase [Singulisphaera acidiphila]AGA26712.1 protein related to regulatory domain of methyltransferases [Singulisphaera acidiphila DSM 18658]
MMADQANPYDEIPYGDHFFPYTHPIHLATLGTLFGIEAPGVDRCRVLELGCAEGGNLFPMALELPDAQFVGIDLSQRQIADGQAVINRLGLRNVELRAMSITEVDESFGQFDYILCHGVFSWVPEPVREKILSICSKNLSPHGLAYVSYNTYPGWHGRGMVRKLLAYHLRRSPLTTPLDQVHGARTFLEEIVRVIPDKASSYARILRTESEYLKGVPNSYLFHEHLEETNHPFYFHEFMDLAKANHLKYLVEARSGGMIENLPEDARESLEEWADDELGREQYLDILCNRTFRQTLLTHEGVRRLDEPSPDALDSLWIGTSLGPVSPDPDVVSLAPEEFRMAEGEASLSTNNPLIKAALVALFEIAPRSIRFETLWERVLSRLGSDANSNTPQDPGHLKQALLRCFMSSLIQLRTRPPVFASEISERPLSSPLARIQAEDEERLINLRGRTVRLDQFERLVLRALDGKNNRQAILDSLLALVDSGEFSIHEEGRPIEDRNRIVQILSGELEPCLERLAARALLVS